MPSLTTALNQEIRRLSRKEIRAEMGATKKAAAQSRRDIAELKRHVKDMTAKLGFLEAQERRRVAQRSPAEARYSPRWLESHRERLGLSLANYGKLLGVSGPSVLAWEQGKAKPTKERMAAWVEIRGLKKREALRRLP